MQAELIQSKNIYEIWVDDKFVSAISPIKGEGSEAYKNRATQEYNKYIDALRQLKNKAVKKTIKTDII